MSKIKYLLPPTPYFKANLHTHSTISDGKLSPSDVKKAYKELGYHILSLTDHNVIIDHSDMNDPDFLMLTGAEININHEQYRPWFDGPTYHINLIAKKPDNLWFPTSNAKHQPGSLDYLDDMQCDDMVLSHTIDSINEMIARANEKGFLVMYNHPTWSCHSYPDYAGLKGLWGAELRNSECCLLGNNENNFRVLKDLWNQGNLVYPLGTDDMHSPRALGLSFIMVGAPALKYDAVINALENGDFYMSCGPEISSLTVEDNRLKISCSDAKCITLENQGRFARRAFADENGTICNAEFDLTDFIAKADGDNSNYIHVTVTAPDGTYAATRPYYLNELV